MTSQKIKNQGRIFSRLTLQDWRQFSTIDIEFHPSLTVITGANGAGKSTILGMLSNHFGWNKRYFATPSTQRKTNGVFSYMLQGIQKLKRLESSPYPPNHLPIGLLIYSDNQTSTPVAINGEASYNVQFYFQKDVPGMIVSSHRAIPHYQQVTTIPTTAINIEQTSSVFYSEMIDRMSGGNSRSSSTFRIKEALIAMATFGEGNSYVDGDKSILNVFLSFNDVLKKILPPSLGFKKLGIRTPEVILETESGDFLLDSASGGIMALIELAWQLHIFDVVQREKYLNTRYVVTIDEPENHLHPSMQRTLMSNLISAFPLAQFIIATHSPFMVSSVKDSHVYVLSYIRNEEENQEYLSNTEKSFLTPRPNVKVYSMKLEDSDKTGTANEVLREVLGVPATIPSWVQSEISTIVEKYSVPQVINEKFISQLREELRSIKCEEFFPEIIAGITFATVKSKRDIK
jgi:predicted ATPase